MALDPVGCKPEIAKTPAVYIEHVGDEDKPIYPIVLATVRPSKEELRCVEPTDDFKVVFLVTEEELEHATEQLKRTRTSGKETVSGNEFRYVLVLKSGMVESGLLDRGQSKKFLTDLASSAKIRQPQLHDILADTLRRFP